MPRFFLPDLSGDTVAIAGEEGRHIAGSLRCRPGDSLELCDGRGTDADAVIRDIAGGTVTAPQPVGAPLPCHPLPGPAQGG